MYCTIAPATMVLSHLDPAGSWLRLQGTHGVWELRSGLQGFALAPGLGRDI